MLRWNLFKSAREVEKPRPFEKDATLRPNEDRSTLADLARLLRRYDSEKADE